MKITRFIILSILLLGGFAPVYAEEDESSIATIDSEPLFSEAELDQMLAPIALYPDTVLSHVLIAATYPLEVIQADRWAKKNADIKGKAALEAVEKFDWDPSIKALVPFPHILKHMSEDLEWTQDLGEAFLADEALILDTIQGLRQRAYDEGNLDSTEYLDVSNDEGNIIIEPATREVVYVPYYDTRVIYGSWWWDSYPPRYWAYDNYHHHSGHIYWAPSVFVDTGFFFSSFQWRARHVVVVDHHHHRRHHFSSGRHVARHADARRWEHDRHHRRGVNYRHIRAREDRRDFGANVRRDVVFDRHREGRSHEGGGRRHREERSAERRRDLVDSMRGGDAIRNNDRAIRHGQSTVTDRAERRRDRDQNAARGGRVRDADEARATRAARSPRNAAPINNGSVEQPRAVRRPVGATATRTPARTNNRLRNINEEPIRSNTSPSSEQRSDSSSSARNSSSSSARASRGSSTRSSSASRSSSSRSSSRSTDSKRAGRGD